MFTSTTNRLMRALPILSAIALCVGAISAQAATVVSTAHYQKQITLACSGINCSGNFPALASKTRLNLTQMNCLIQASAGSTFSLGGVGVVNANNGIVAPEHFSSVYSSSDGNHVVNLAVDMQVAATQHIQVSFNLASGTPGHGYCTATGTMDTLQ